MKPIFIAIAGGSGSGKSTLTNALQKAYPNQIAFVHFDDYQKEEAEVNILHGMKNWDHPQAINFDALLADLNALENNKSVKIMTKNRSVNPEYEKIGRVPHMIIPKKIIIVEGYMTLVDERIRKFFDYSFFLDLPFKISVNRRDKITDPNQQKYNEMILEPMHEAFIVPCKKLADTIIDAEKSSAEAVLKTVESVLQEKFL